MCVSECGVMRHRVTTRFMSFASPRPSNNLGRRWIARFGKVTEYLKVTNLFVYSIKKLKGTYRKLPTLV